MKHLGWLFALLVLLSAAHAMAQSDLDLDALDQKLQSHLEKKMPGWEHRRIQPIEGSKAVLIQTWTIPNRGVKISITRSKSATEAKEHLQNFMREVKGEPLAGLGDEAFVWGFDGSDMEVRKGRYIFDLNAGANVMRDPDALGLTPAERSVREKAEVKRIIREFAKHVTDAIDVP